MADDFSVVDLIQRQVENLIAAARDCPDPVLHDHLIEIAYDWLKQAGGDPHWSGRTLLDSYLSTR
jgi:hypothetical protein